MKAKKKKKIQYIQALPYSSECKQGSAEMSTPKMSLTPKFLFLKGLLCQDVYSQHVYCAKMSTPKMSSFNFNLV